MPQSEYDPGYVAFGGGSTHTVIHPSMMVALVVVLLFIFLLPRKYIMIPLFLGLMLIPSGQNFYVSGFHLYLHRVIISVSCIRMLGSRFSGKLLPGGFTALDRIFIVWAIFRSSAQILQYMQWGAVPNQASFLWQAIVGYFLFRWLILDDEDVQRVLKVFVVVALVAATGMIYEHATKLNLFGFLG